MVWNVNERNFSAISCAPLAKSALLKLIMPFVGSFEKQNNEKIVLKSVAYAYVERCDAFTRTCIEFAIIIIDESLANSFEITHGDTKCEMISNIELTEKQIERGWRKRPQSVRCCTAK